MTEVNAPRRRSPISSVRKPNDIRSCQAIDLGVVEPEFH
jgi:hypothetical protein